MGHSGLQLEGSEEMADWQWENIGHGPGRTRVRPGQIWIQFLHISCYFLKGQQRVMLSGGDTDKQSLDAALKEFTLW